MFCSKCGNQVAEGAGFCHKCGAKTIVAQTPQQTPVAPTATQQPIEPVAPSPAYIPNPTVPQNTAKEMSLKEDMRKFTLPNAMSNTEICEILRANLSRCPAIEDVSLHPESGFVLLKAKKYTHIVQIAERDVTVVIGSSRLPSVFLSIAIGFIGMGAANIGMSGFDFENMMITIPLIIGLVTMTATVGITRSLANSESKKILPYIRKTLGLMQ